MIARVPRALTVEPVQIKRVTRWVVTCERCGAFAVAKTSHAGTRLASQHDRETHDGTGAVHVRRH